MEWEKKTVINELKQGKELTKQLKNHLNPSFSSSSSPETRKFLIEKILSSYEKALSMLNWSTNSTTLINEADSSPTNDGSDDLCSKEHVSKKRKIMDKWSEKVRVTLQNGLDQGPNEDGYSWRKYGQKDILGSIHPRGYYRCTHRNVQGCLATKQLQRSDADPTALIIKYRGRHTCNQTGHLIPKVAILHKEQEPELAHNKAMLLNFSTNLKVKTEDLEKERHVFPSFTFPTTPVMESLEVDSSIFSHFGTMGDPNNFISPTSSDSNYFDLSPNCTLKSFSMGYMYTSESDFTEIISATPSVSNSPMPIEDLNFSLGSMEFDAYFPLGN